MAELQSTAVRHIREVKTKLIERLESAQRRLIRLHVEEGDDISPDAFRAERQSMGEEIAAARESLAETEQRLTLDAAQLRIALEVAQEVSTLYRDADQQTKRR